MAAPSEVPARSRPPAAGGSRCRRGFTALEGLIAAVLGSLVIGGALAMFGTGSRGMTQVTEHAAARDEAYRLLDRMRVDLDRVVVGDGFDFAAFPSVVEPVSLEARDEGPALVWYAYHHRRFARESRKLTLVGRRMEYRVVDAGGGGVDLLRNGKLVNRQPLGAVRFSYLDADEAGTIGVSPRHAIRVEIEPRMGGTRGDEVAARHAEERVFHLKGVESQYACLLTLKRAKAPYPILAFLPEPPRQARLHDRYQLDQVPLDWIRPQGLVVLENDPYDDASEHEHEVVE